MTRIYLVYGSNWAAKVEIPNVETLPEGSLQVEAATRAVEARFGKRHDIDWGFFTPRKISKKKADNELYSAIWELLTDELKSGCGIGTLIAINEVTNPDDEQEWFINSKSILENVGVPSLIKAFNEKYPNNKNETTT